MEEKLTQEQIKYRFQKIVNHGSRQNEPVESMYRLAQEYGVNMSRYHPMMTSQEIIKTTFEHQGENSSLIHELKKEGEGLQ